MHPGPSKSAHDAILYPSNERYILTSLDGSHVGSGQTGGSASRCVTGKFPVGPGRVSRTSESLRGLGSTVTALVSVLMIVEE